MSCLFADASSIPHSNSSNNKRRIYNVIIFLMFKVRYLGRLYKEIFCFNVGRIKWCAWGHPAHQRVSWKSTQAPLTSSQYVSILNHADLQILTWAFPSEHHCLIFFFWISTLLFINVNLLRGVNKIRPAFLSSVFEQQACYEKPMLKALLRVLLWRRLWMPERWWRLSWNARFYLYSWASSCGINSVQAFLLDRGDGFCI